MADIECRSCGTMNDAQEQRCVRCSRRLHFAATQPAPEARLGMSSGISSVPGRSGAAAATAPAFESYPEGAPAPATPAEQVDRQPSLFQGAGSPKVVPIPTLTPLRTSVREGHVARRVSPRAPASSRSTPSRPRTNPDSQQTFDLQEAGDSG